MHVRVKRKDTTFFLNVAPTDYVLEVKQRLQDLTEKDPSEQQLVKGRAVLDDAKSLAEQRVENGDVIALVLKSGEGEFEAKTTLWGPSGNGRSSMRKLKAAPALAYEPVQVGVWLR